MKRKNTSVRHRIHGLCVHPPALPPPPRPPPASPHTPSVSFGFPPPPHFCVPPPPPSTNTPHMFPHVHVVTHVMIRFQPIIGRCRLLFGRSTTYFGRCMYILLYISQIFLSSPKFIHTSPNFFWEMSDNNLGEVIKSWEKSFFSQ